MKGKYSIYNIVIFSITIDQRNIFLNNYYFFLDLVDDHKVVEYLPHS